VSSSIIDLKELHTAYTRLSEKFKTLWTFHQFLQGVHKTFFGDTPGYHVDFQGLYDQIRALTQQMTFQPPATVLETIHRFEDQLETIYRQLDEDDQKISPNYVRRFFEKVRTEDEKLLLSLLRFYFFARAVSHDGLDKMDFLITLVGARRSLDDGRYMTRFPVELQKLFGGFLSLSRRAPPEPNEVQAAERALGVLRREIESCQRFEELSEKKILENVRTLKHRLGSSFYSVEVLSAILETNLAAKNKFQALYEEEEQRILASSRQLLEMEKELEKNPRLGSDSLQEDFKKFRQYKEEFEREHKEKGVRHQDVVRLAESIDQLMMKFELVSDSQDKAGAVPASAPMGPAEAQDEEGPPSQEIGLPGVSRRITTDPLTSEAASRILYSVELIDEGTGSGRSAYSHNLARLRLEPWEVRAARRVLRDELPTDPASRTRDLLFFEAAALRIRIEDEAKVLRVPPKDETERLALTARVSDSGLCLMRAQELDRRFRGALEEAAHTAPPEKLNELTRSRFRLLRGFSGLWLLHNAHSN
jgi:hypothetical protein